MPDHAKKQEGQTVNIRLYLVMMLIACVAWTLGTPCLAQVRGDATPATAAPPPPPAPTPQEAAQPDQPEPPQPGTVPGEENAADPTPQPSPKKIAPPPPRTLRGVQPPMPPTPAPVTPAAKKEEVLPKTGETPKDPVSFDFNDASLQEVIKSIGAMTGKNFDLANQAIATTKVTIVTHDQIPPDMAFQILESVLAARGLSIVEAIPGKLYRIVGTGESPDKLPISIGKDNIPKVNDAVSTHIITPKYISVEEVSDVLSKLGSSGAPVGQQPGVDRVIAFPKTNTLVITDTADGLRRMLKFLEEVDVQGYDTEMKIFTLEYSRAETISNQIQEVILGTSNAVGGQRNNLQQPQPQRVNQPARTTRAPIPGQASTVIVGTKEETLRIVPDDRLNALVVVASKDLMAQVKDLVEKLDSPTPYEKNVMNTYRLLNSDCEEVEKTLTAILGGVTARQDGGGSGGGMPGRGMATSAAQNSELQPFEKKVQVTSFKQSNSLVILAAPQDYKLIKEIIRQLDMPKRQVLVEAIIMDVKIQNQYGLSIDSAAIKGNDGFAEGGTSNINTLLSTTDLATSLTDGTTPLTMAKAITSLGTSGGLTAGVYDHINAVIDGEKVKIPFVPFLLKALETLTDIDVLSQPSLTTQDNKESTITSGQEIPIPTQRSGYSTSTSGTGSTTTNPIYGLTNYGSGISRQDVGVKMKVTPHINEGDYVSLETEIEISETANSSVGIDPNELGPTLNKSQVKNNVLVKDGTTGVIGGLIKESADHTRKQTPYLGDIPVINLLFRSKNDNRKKENIVVLITPFIIKEGTDLERVTEHKMDQFRNANIDALFEKGIIKRIKKRQEMRSNYYPSIKRSEEMTQENAFGRGDMKK